MPRPSLDPLRRAHMRPLRLLLTVFVAAAILGALVASASARNLSNSSTSIGATWTRMDFTGGFGIIECEVVLQGTMHSRTMPKVANSLIVYITAGNIPRCAAFGMTILRETLPWHVTYRNFGGTLPNITSIGTNLIGYAFRFREPSFGATCLARSTAASPNILTHNREAGGRITSVTMSGSIPCRGALTFAGSLSGTSSSISPLTVTLI